MEYSHRLDLTIAGFPVAVVVQQGDISSKSVLRSGCWCRLDLALTTWWQGIWKFYWMKAHICLMIA